MDEKIYYCFKFNVVNLVIIYFFRYRNEIIINLKYYRNRKLFVILFNILNNG